MKIKPLGESAVLVEWGDEAENIRRLAAIMSARQIPGIWDIVPAHSTVAVFYDPARVVCEGNATPHETVGAWVESAAAVLAEGKVEAAKEHVLPVCYGGVYGPDLEMLAKEKGLSPDDVIALHSGAVYRVRAVGFSPGFPYLDGLPKILHMPRKASPRLSVPAGSIGIGGEHTGVYTLETPGGWHLIGRTPVALFNPAAERPALLRVGDTVKFRVIPAEEMKGAAS